MNVPCSAEGERSDPRSERVPRQRNVYGLLAGWLALILPILVMVGASLPTLSSSYDDAFITYRYVRNLAAGRGFVYNVGEQHLGTTTPLYTILLATLSKLLPFPIPLLSGWVSLLSWIACALFLWRTAVYQRCPGLGLVILWTVALNGLFLPTFGGEELFFLALVAAAIFTYVTSYSCRYILPICGVLLSLAFLTRGEGAILALLLVVHYMLTRRRLPWPLLVAGALTVLPWLVYSLMTFGSFLPSTLEAKIIQGRSGLWRHGYFMRDLYQYVKMVGFDGQRVCLALLACLGAVGAWGAWRRERTWLLLLGWVFLYLMGYQALGVPMYHWYVAPLALAMSVSAALGVYCLWAQDFRSLGGAYRSTLRTVLRGSACIMVCLAFFPLAKDTFTYASTLPQPSALFYKAVAQWLVDHTPASATVAALEIGHIGYYSDRYIVDWAGLVTPDARQDLLRGDFHATLHRHKPDYVLYDPRFRGWLEPLLFRPWFQAAYEKVDEISSDRFPGYSMVIYRKRPSADTVRPVYDLDCTQMGIEVTAGEIYGSQTVGQTFVARCDNLSRILVFLATHARRNEGEVIFHLRRRGAEADIYTERFAAADVEDLHWRRFDFPPVPDSAGKEFYFFLEGIGTAPGQAITVMASQSDGYAEGALMRGHIPQKGDLVFRTYCRRFILTNRSNRVILISTTRGGSSLEVSF